MYYLSTPKKVTNYYHSKKTHELCYITSIGIIVYSVENTYLVSLVFIDKDIIKEK